MFTLPEEIPVKSSPNTTLNETRTAPVASVSTEKLSHENVTHPKLE